MTTDFTPLQDAIMEVLACRHRLGEPFWPMDTNAHVTRALRTLQDGGWLTFDSAVTPHWRAELTEQGRAKYMSPTYSSPVESKLDSAHRRIKELEQQLVHADRALNRAVVPEGEDWTLKDGASNRSDRFIELVEVVTQLLNSDRYLLMEGTTGRRKTAGLIMAQLAHKHGVRA